MLADRTTALRPARRNLAGRSPRSHDWACRRRV